MLFITNRSPKGSSRSKNGRSFKFDLNENEPRSQVYCCRRNGSGDYTEIGAKGLLDDLRKNKYKQILLYVHGYSNLPEPDIFPRAIKLQKFFDQKSPDNVAVVVLKGHNRNENKVKGALLFYDGNVYKARLIRGSYLIRNGYFYNVIESISNGAVLKLNDNSLWSVPDYDQ